MQVLLPRRTLTKYNTPLRTYCKAFQCASHTPDYQPISKLLGKDENAVLANLGMRTVATPADGNEVILRNEVVQQVNKAKFLGVIVDQHLNWKTTFQKTSKSYGIIYRIRNTLEFKSKRLIYNSPFIHT